MMVVKDKHASKPDHNSKLKENIAVHIFSVSAAMVGVCLTVIGIFQIGKLREIGSVSDNILAIDALAFLVSCILSYIALRTSMINRRQILERAADTIFIAALSLMAIICILVAYTFI